MFVTELKLAEGDSDIDLSIEGVKHEVSLRDNAAGTQFLNFFLFTIFFCRGGGSCIRVEHFNLGDFSRSYRIKIIKL